MRQWRLAAMYQPAWRLAMQPASVRKANQHQNGIGDKYRSIESAISRG
jgi:hypothetical protein